MGVLNEKRCKQKVLDPSNNSSDYHFWSTWTQKRARAVVNNDDDTTTMDGKVQIDFYFDFSKLKSLNSPGGAGGTRRIRRRRRIVSRRLKKSHRSFSTRKNRRVYRK